MNEYQRLESKIISYLSREEVKRTDNVISFYDLYKIIDKKFELLRNIQLNNKLIEKINRDNAKKKTQKFIIRNLDNILATT